jgi:hypothetical protein
VTDKNVSSDCGERTVTDGHFFGTEVNAERYVGVLRGAERRTRIRWLGVIAGPSVENVIFSIRRLTSGDMLAFYAAPGDGRAFVTFGVRSFDFRLYIRRSFLRRSFVTIVVRLGRRSFVTFGVRSFDFRLYIRRSFLRRSFVTFVVRSFDVRLSHSACVLPAFVCDIWRSSVVTTGVSQGVPVVVSVTWCPRGCFPVIAHVCRWFPRSLGNSFVFPGPFRESGGLSGFWVCTSQSPGNSSAL